MPRLINPPPMRKHSRTHLREQRDRAIARNWQRAKTRYSHARHSAMHPDEARAHPDASGAYWPFTLKRGHMARNPFNLCSCSMCSHRPEHSRLRRHRENQYWQGFISEELSELDLAETFTATMRWRASANSHVANEW